MSTTQSGITLGQSALSNDQLDELIEQAARLAESGDDTARDNHEKLLAVRQQRVELEQRLAEMQERERSRGNKRLRAKEPTERAVNAAASFMADAERVAAWDDAITEARQADGTIAVTGRIVQLTIGAYFAERNRTKKATTPVAEAAPENAAAATQNEDEQESDGMTVADAIFSDLGLGSPEEAEEIAAEPVELVWAQEEPAEASQEVVEAESEPVVESTTTKRQPLTADDLLQSMSVDLSQFDFSALDQEDAS